MAAAASFALYHALGLPQGYWAVFTTVIVVQNSVGATLNTAVERMIGTIFGALVGAAAALLHPQTAFGLGAALVVSVLVTAFGAALRPQLKVAPVTAVIMLISPSGGLHGPLDTAVLRVVEIALGSIIGLAATLLVFPAPAHRAAARRIAGVLDDLAGLIEASAARLRGEAVDTFALSTHVRTALVAVEAAVTDAARERSTRLADTPLPEAVVRTLWRVRNDTVILARAAEEGLPETVRPHLAEPAQALLAAEAAFARTCGQSLVEGRRVKRDALAEARAGFGAAVEAIRRERVNRDITFEAVSPYFGLVFAAESLQRNLDDLADRIEEAEGASTRLAGRSPAVSRP